jgi:acyl carrier protein
MGLDTVELVMEFEREFDITIPDAEAARMQTVADTLRFIVAELARKSPDPDSNARAFYEPNGSVDVPRVASKLRHIIAEQMAIDPKDVHPDSRYIEDLGAG